MNDWATLYPWASHCERLPPEAYVQASSRPRDSLGGHYWTVDDVRGEVESLAQQLVAAANPGVQSVLDAVRAGVETEEE